jgi:tetratricopeptide (TPR) repeat protein
LEFISVGTSDQQKPRQVDPDAYVKKIKKALKHPDSEAGRFRRVQFLRKADKWLCRYRLNADAAQSIDLLHIRVMRALRDFERVVATVRAIGWRKEATRARALLEAAEAHTELQEFASADRCLQEALRLVPNLEARAAAIRTRLQAQLRSDLYGRLSAFVNGAVRSYNIEAAEFFYKSAAHVWGMTDVAAGEAASVLRELGMVKGRRPSVSEIIDTAHACRIVMTCGSGYSGTGAVTAFLREHDGLPMPFGLRELAVLKKNYGLSRLIAKWNGWSATEREDALNAAVLQAILGVPCYESSLSVDRLHTRSVTLNSLFAGESLCDDDARGLGDLARRFVMRLGVDASLDVLKQACAQFLNSVLRLKGGEVALFNNCIHQTQISMCELLENARVIVIKRDPRDQYVAHQTETQGRGITVEAFISKRKRADAAVNRYLVSGRANVRRFDFEAFVMDAAVREEVRAWAGVAHLGTASSPRYFFPEQSQKNVGIHVSWKDQSEIRLIERELRDQLVDL